MTFDIRNLATGAELRAVHSVIAQLRPHLDADSFVAQALRQIERGYRATALFDASIPRAYAGWRVQESLVRGVHLYVDDLVTDGSVRSRGHGKALLDWLKAEARRLDCASLQLDSGTQRQDAHAFYLREGLRIQAFHFGIALNHP